MSQPEVLTDIMKMMEGLTGEWEYAGPITPDTRLFADMELKSLDFVILSAEVSKRFGRLPFDVYYAELAEIPPEEREVTVTQFADFVYQHLARVAESR